MKTKAQAAVVKELREMKKLGMNVPHAAIAAAENPRCFTTVYEPGVPVRVLASLFIELAAQFNTRA